MTSQEEVKGIPDAKILVNDRTEQRIGTELIGSNGSGLPEKLGKFTTVSDCGVACLGLCLAAMKT